MPEDNGKQNLNESSSNEYEKKLFAVMVISHNRYMSFSINNKLSFIDSSQFLCS